MLNGEISHWMSAARRRASSGHRASSGQQNARPDAAVLSVSNSLPRKKQDLVIIGGGLTGLWLAYTAIKKHPDWAVTVVEKDSVGTGASGRNGGWLSPLLPFNRAVADQVAQADASGHTADAAELQRVFFRAVDDVLEIINAEGIDCGACKGGNLEIAQTQAEMRRLLDRRDIDLRSGFTADDVLVLSAQQVADRTAISGVVGGLYYPQAAVIDPAELTRGLAATVRKLGVRICESTEAFHVGPERVVTDRGPVSGASAVVCVEAYTGSLRGPVPGVGPREVVPVNSSMIVTEQLPQRFWQEVGWNNRELLGDSAHQFIYAQRTDDDRIAIGGRGSPYEFGSRTAGDGRVDASTIELLRARLESFFPGWELPLAHAWRGSIGVTRDWCAGVFYDQKSGLGSVRGFAGHGVTATLVAARTLLDRIDDQPLEDSVYRRLPWNDHDSGRWEPEPVRWLGIHTMYRLFGIADALERRGGGKRTSLVARLGAKLAGLGS